MAAQPLCACGKARLTDNAGFLQCPNCDRLQVQELTGGNRTVTAQDHKYQLAMKQRQNEWYKK